MMRFVGFLASLAMMAGIGLAQAAAPPQVAQCAGCHGQNGMGNPSAGFPALAGQPAKYLDSQLYAFKHGSRQNSLMQGFASSLNAADRKAIANYYHDLPVVAPASLPEAPKSDVGADLAIHGAGAGTDHAIPACESCHGAGGRGVGPLFPRLAGQPAKYLEAQLFDWQKGTRNETNVHIMQQIAVMLSSNQVKAVAAYFASQSPVPSAK